MPTQFNLFNKLKRFNPVESPLSVFASFLLVLCLLGFLFYSDPWLSNAALRPHQSTAVDRGDLVGCDFTDGKWVMDETYPLYNPENCGFLDREFRCIENGRPDNLYAKWRWQPSRCNLPRFDAKLMLEKLRNKRVAFVGDSIGRNQWESLLCMLASAIPNKSSIHQLSNNGRVITKHTGHTVFVFEDYNCTAEYYRSPFLVARGLAPAAALNSVKMTLRVDRLDPRSRQWKDADLLVFNSGHWWNYDKTIRMGYYFQEGNEVKMNMSVEVAFQKSMETLVHWVNRRVNTNKTLVFFRTYAPGHFSGGNWKTGGSCDLNTLPDPSAPSRSKTWPQVEIVNSVLSKAQSKVHSLNVTYMSAQRRDGHASVYYVGLKPAPRFMQDCSHWCLPGVPDTWNQLFYASFFDLDRLHSKWNRYLG